MVMEYVELTRNNNYFEANRRSQAKYWMYESINEQLRNHFYQREEIKSGLELNEKLVLNDEKSSFMAAKDLLDKYFKNIK